MFKEQASSLLIFFAYPFLSNSTKAYFWGAAVCVALSVSVRDFVKACSLCLWMSKEQEDRILPSGYIYLHRCHNAPVAVTTEMCEENSLYCIAFPLT